MDETGLITRNPRMKNLLGKICSVIEDIEYAIPDQDPLDNITDQDIADAYAASLRGSADELRRQIWLC
jgi:hypothetical protein